MDLNVTPLLISDPHAVGRVAQIYEAAIPASERKATAELIALAQRPDYRFDVVMADGAVAGFAVWFWPGEEGFALLEYLAVDAEHRGRGLGAVLVRHGLSSGRTILAEVEADDPAHPERARRAAFYGRLGFGRVAGLDYALPLRSAGVPPAMRLLVWRPDPVTPLPRGTLGRWLGVIYERVYGQAARDPRVGEMMEGVGDPVEVE